MVDVADHVGTCVLFLRRPSRIAYRWADDNDNVVRMVSSDTMWLSIPTLISPWGNISWIRVSASGPPREKFPLHFTQGWLQFLNRANSRHNSFGTLTAVAANYFDTSISHRSYGTVIVIVMTIVMDIFTNIAPVIVTSIHIFTSTDATTVISMV